MREKARTVLLLCLGLTCATTIATWFDPVVHDWGTRRAAPADLMTILLGDARLLLANHFIKKADVYFHSGYYPSVFHEAWEARKTEHLRGHEQDEAAHEKAMAFLTQPRDIIDRFGRNFYPTHHEHLSGKRVAEILPWLRFSASLDPNRIEAYVIGAYWLRAHLQKPKEAERFLKEGLAANPGNPELMFELGRLYHEDYGDVKRASNVLYAALVNWEKTAAPNPNDDQLVLLGRIAVYLAHIREKNGDLQGAIELYEEMLRRGASANPDATRARINEWKARLGRADR